MCYTEGIVATGYSQDIKYKETDDKSRFRKPSLRSDWTFRARKRVTDISRSMSFDYGRNRDRSRSRIKRKQSDRKNSAAVEESLKRR